MTAWYVLGAGICVYVRRWHLPPCTPARPPHAPTCNLHCSSPRAQHCRRGCRTERRPRSGSPCLDLVLYWYCICKNSIYSPAPLSSPPCPPAWQSPGRRRPGRAAPAPRSASGRRQSPAPWGLQRSAQATSLLNRHSEMKLRPANDNCRRRAACLAAPATAGRLRPRGTCRCQAAPIAAPLLSRSFLRFLLLGPASEAAAAPAAAAAAPASSAARCTASRPAAARGCCSSSAADRSLAASSPALSSEYCCPGQSSSHSCAACMLADVPAAPACVLSALVMPMPSRRLARAFSEGRRLLIHSSSTRHVCSRVRQLRLLSASENASKKTVSIIRSLPARRLLDRQGRVPLDGGGGRAGGRP